MLSLRELQLEMRDQVLSPRRLADGGKDVYRYAYGARLEGVLASNYPVLARRRGEGAFAELAREYVTRYPSAHYNVRWYGAHLWRLLTGAEADLARMEWALGLAFDAPDAAPLTSARLAAVPVDAWAELPIMLHPSVHLLYMSWPAEKLWQGVDGHERAHLHDLFVWRKDLQAHWRIAGAQEGLALRTLRQCGTLQRACDALPEEVAAQIGPWFAGWVQEGMLAVRGQE